MNGSRRSIPFHVTLLTLMVLIVLPLAAALLWLGWRAVDQLEDRSVRHRMAALDAAVEGFLMSGLRVVVAVGSTLAETQAFAPGSTVADEERLRQFAVVIGRYPAMAAIYVGYEDGRFLYVGRTETLSISQRLEFDAPDAPSLLDAHDRGRRGHAPRDLVVPAGRRHPLAGPDAHGRLRPARAALVRRRDARPGRGADRALQLCPGQGRRRVGRHAAAGRAA